MKHLNKILLVTSLALGLTAQAQATTQSLAADGQWQEFNVSDYDALSHGKEWIDFNNTNDAGFGSALSFNFTIANGYVGTLTVVDGGFSGDQFQILNNGVTFGQTSATTAMGSDSSMNFAANLANADYSHGTYLLGAGTYSITGNLLSTTQDFSATAGALKLEVAPVPEPETYAMLLAGLGLMAAIGRRRSRA
jgi:hypothetical protein